MFNIQLVNLVILFHISFCFKFSERAIKASSATKVFIYCRINKDMAINCSRYCNEESFLSLLNRFRIIKGSHSRTEDGIESLVTCLSCLKPEPEIRRLIEILTTESEDSDRVVNIHTSSLMHVGSEFEYGPHNNMYFFNSNSIVGLLMALSNALDIRIFVICGSLPLRILHKDEFVLQFNYGEESSSKIVIGLVGLTIFHKLNQPEDESITWDTLIRESKEITESMLNFLSSDLNRDIIIPNHQNSMLPALVVA